MQGVFKEASFLPEVGAPPPDWRGIDIADPADKRRRRWRAPVGAVLSLTVAGALAQVSAALAC